MCTAIRFNNSLFGRNLDVDSSYGEKVIITPRKYPFIYNNNHYAFIGTGIVIDDYPLYFDGTNEMGLSIAALRFKGCAYYFMPFDKKINIPSYDFINYILSNCKTVKECKNLLKNVNITNKSFSEKLPNEPLHWMISDKKESITVESVKNGLKIYHNKYDILTNEPTFDIHIENIEKEKIISWDYSAESRFLRGEHIKCISSAGNNKNEKISCFFHILSSVAQQKNTQKNEFTLYSSCCDIEKIIYYYKTYDNFSIRCVDINKENLNGKSLICYEMNNDFQIFEQN